MSPVLTDGFFTTEPPGKPTSTILQLKKESGLENSLVVQWLGLHASIARSPDSVLGQETKIPQAAWHGQKKKKTPPYDTSIKEKPVIIAINKHVRNNCYKNSAIKFCLGVMAS